MFEKMDGWDVCSFVKKYKAADNLLSRMFALGHGHRAEGKTYRI